ncbi:Nn.00g086190.m01.CDS01 [Neocucurbitaria sp. VM-36]
MASTNAAAPALQLLDAQHGHAFAVPAKRIHDGDDVSFFLASKAYADIMTFIFQLNTSMLPRAIKREKEGTASTKEWRLNDPQVPCPQVTLNLAKLLETLAAIIDDAPPDPGPRRFGNVSFRVWYNLVRERIPGLLDQCLPDNVLAFKSTSDISVKAELEAYLVGSFGSSQRLDYGTGHELSFLAFLGCLWKLGAFPESIDGDQERGIVLGVIEPYLALVRRLILTYTLEPAGSHGVWGLDDHSFLPYIFGSAQFSPAITHSRDVAAEGSLPDAPNPADVAKANAVERERRRNMYFSAIGFIYDVKRGPFWEHSPILYDISGVKAGWAKINKGMIKMYNVEVLSKYPVVQHFPFGSLFVWEKDPNAKVIQASVHTSSQPKSTTPLSTAPTARPQPSITKSQPPLRDPLADTSPTNARGHGGNPATSAPWTTTRGAPQVPGGANPLTRAPWASATSAPAIPSGPNQPTRAPWTSRTPLPPTAGGGTTAPWAKGGGGGNGETVKGTAGATHARTQAPGPN